MAWLILILAGLTEVIWAVGLKKTENFTRLGPTLWTIPTMILSFYLLSLAMKSIPLGTAYAVWTGIGAVGTVIFGMLYLNEPKDMIRIVCIALIVSGILGLKFLSRA